MFFGDLDRSAVATLIKTAINTLVALCINRDVTPERFTRHAALVSLTDQLIGVSVDFDPVDAPDFTDRVDTLLQDRTQLNTCASGYWFVLLRGMSDGLLLRRFGDGTETSLYQEGTTFDLPAPDHNLTCLSLGFLLPDKIDTSGLNPDYVQGVLDGYKHPPLLLRGKVEGN